MNFFSIFRFDQQTQLQYEPESLPPQELVTKQRSPAARANSMPPRASRPQVLKKIGDFGDAKETYSINGVNYTTYTTFRSPLTPDEIPDVNFIEKPPMIPEPDYEEPNMNSNTNGQYSSRTLERKKKKSVSFLEDISKKEETSVKRIGKLIRPCFYRLVCNPKHV